jgi:imidazolonepropionase-like amidohydrolase
VLGAADSLGVVQAGAAADFVILAGDPLADIANVARIQTVVAYGVEYDPQELRRTR